VNKLQVKILSALNADSLEYVPIFHQWIRERRLDELLIDVVDYSHVRHGPEVMLVGHESDYVIDRTGGRLGLLYAQKRPRPTACSPWLGALKRALAAGALLQQEVTPTMPLAFRSDTLILRVADRLSAPNSDETFKRWLPAVESALEVLYGTTPFTLTRTGTPRDLFAIEVQAPGAPALDELLARLSSVN
jgi:hypothetical protein